MSMKSYVWSQLVVVLVVAGCSEQGPSPSARPDADAQGAMSDGGQDAGPQPGDVATSDGGGRDAGPLPGDGPTTEAGAPLAADGGGRPACPGEAVVVVQADVGPAPAPACPAACASPPCALATGQQVPFRLAVDDRWVFWTTRGKPCDGAIVRLAKGGGAPAPLVTGEDDPTYLVIDADTLYWAAARTIRSIRKDGTAPLVVAGGLAGPEAVAVDSERVYFRAHHPTAGVALIAAPRAGGATSVLASGHAVRGVAVDGQHVYFTTNDFPGAGVFRVEKRIGATPTAIARDQLHAWGILLDGERVYWTDYGLQGQDGAVFSALKDGSDRRTLARTQVESIGAGGAPTVAVDETHVYWVESDYERGRVMRVRKGGSEITVLAADQKGPNGVAVDRCGVYWSNIGDPRAAGGGSIWFLPR